MRSLYATALLGVSTTAVAYHVTKSDINPITETLFLTLQLPVDEDGFEIVRLPLDFHPSDKTCDPDALTINGDSLPVGSDGDGSGLVRLESGETLSTAWSFSCHGHAEVIDLIVQRFNGEDIPWVSITVTYLTSPDGNAGNVVVSQQHLIDASASQGGTEEVREQQHSEVQSQLSQIESLHAQAAQLEGYGNAQDEGSSADYDNSNARNIRKKLAGERQGSGNLRTIIQSGGNSKQQALIVATISQPDSYEEVSKNDEEGYYNDGNDEDVVYVYLDESHDQTLVAALALGLMAFSLFSLFSLLYTYRERIRTTLAERRARRRHRQEQRWFRTWAERRAAREARKQAVRDFFARIFCSFMSQSAIEKKAAEDERRRALVQRQAEEGTLHQSEQFVNMSERISHDAQQTSMAQEIAGLRAAAALVDDIVSAATTRLRPHQQQEQQQQQQQRQHAPQAPPMSVRAASPEFVVYDDVPPTYEEQLQDSAVVADGFRYEPGARPQYSHTLATLSLSNDRLGYDK